MMQINEQILKDAENFVEKFLNEKLPKTIVFHDINHAKYVAQKAEEIGAKSELTDAEISIVKLCALFHDTGYVGNPVEHEKISAQIAGDFLKQKNIDENTIQFVKDCILTTKITNTPQNKVAKVLCDADTMHLVEPDYFKRIDKMRKEWGNLGEKMSKQEFYKNSVRFFKKHKFYTNYAKEELCPKKEKNLKLIKKEIKKIDKKKSKKKDKEKNKKVKGYSRGVESMFRNTARMQINLSSIADKKSNILISVNAIIISITMSVLVSRFDEMPNIIIPTFIFLIFSLITIIFAILSTRPHVSSGTFDKNNIADKSVNLLFFGNFYNMKLEEYETALEELMRNDDQLYSTMIKDQYNLGKVLARKYQLLRVSYNVFMVGIVISVLAFVFSFIGV